MSEGFSVSDAASVVHVEHGEPAGRKVLVPEFQRGVTGGRRAPVNLHQERGQRAFGGPEVRVLLDRQKVTSTD